LTACCQNGKGTMIVGIPFHKTLTLLGGESASNGILVVECSMFEYTASNLTYTVIGHKCVFFITSWNVCLCLVA
jgi:hypothetical protein